MNRRKFLKISGITTIGAIAASCKNFTGDSKKHLNTQPKKVSIARIKSYDPQILRRKIQDMLDGIGGVQDIVKSGDRVALKVNLIGGMDFIKAIDVPPTEAYWTHPEVVRAVTEAVLDAGAKDTFIIDNDWDGRTFRGGGYTDLAATLGAKLIDLNSPAPYKNFMCKQVGEGWQVYRSYMLNRILDEIDVFISIPKMKCHQNCGVTLSLKNLIGIVPVKEYELKKGDGYRSAFHGRGHEFRVRLPRIIVDLNRVRPIDLAVIDGIKTAEGGEGPWVNKTFAAGVEANVLIASKDAVAADSVATSVMGFAPWPHLFNSPFFNSWDYLSLARKYGLGTNRLDEIEIVGPRIGDVVRRFRACEII